MNDYYNDLGVAQNASTEDIKRAYRRLARKLHPDINPSPEAADEFKKISQAYDVLGDPDKHQAYDMGNDPYGVAGGAQGFSFGDVMDAFFGGTAATAGGMRSRMQRGQDTLVPVEIDLRTAVFAGTEDLTFDTAVVCKTCHGDGACPGSGKHTCDICHGSGQVQRSILGQVMTTRPCQVCRGCGEIIDDPCFDCSGAGRTQDKRTISVKIPAGVDSGTRIRLTGEGEVGPTGGPAGDLYVEVRVVKHSTFQQQGDDLHCSVELPMTAASLGTTLPLETLDGVRDVTIKPGIQSGDVITLRGLGMTQLRTQLRGDLMVHANVRVPTCLDPQQEVLLRQLAKERGEERPEPRFDRIEKGLFGKLRDAFQQK